jgi:3-oxoacyl-[acyl-carrier-protein] synthase II
VYDCSTWFRSVAGAQQAARLAPRIPLASRWGPVWITGIGIITSIGIGMKQFRTGLGCRLSPIKRVDRFDPSPFRSQVAAQVDDFEPGTYMDRRAVRSLDRFSQFGVACGRLAFEDADFRPGRLGQVSSDRVGIFLGSALGGIAFAEGEHERYIERGIRAVSPMLALAVFGGAAAANLGIALGIRGPILSTANSCASGADAIGAALRSLRCGDVDAALAGGVETPLSALAFGAFDTIRALASAGNDEPARACRPFDSYRSGFVLAEGASLLVLERADAATRRGARPYAELRGFGSTSDAFHMVQPKPDGSEAARAVSLALTDAGDDVAAIDYVNAHASSTPLGDAAEARALARAFGGPVHAPVSGTKALYGHPLGATGAIEAAILALAIRDGWAPQSVNLDHPDVEIAELLPGLIRDTQGYTGTLRRALSTSFGFGGLNAALVLGAIDG